MKRQVSDCRTDVVATLLAFTQPLPPASSAWASGHPVAAEDALARSLWTQMVQEVLKYIHSCSGPAAFITGLQVRTNRLALSEL